MKISKIHFVGIKGVGMTPLAVIAKQAGFSVSGSDVGDKFITDEILAEEDIKPFIGFSPDHLKDCDLVITTGAHGGFANIEVKKAKAMGIKLLTQGEAVGFFMNGTIFNRNFIGISVAGTHGKTTTTAMVATILHTNNFDPSFVIGTGKISSLGAPGHYGKGKYFVAEADEYATEPTFDKTPKFLWQYPKIAVVTNIEFDHPDIYASFKDVLNAFIGFATKLPKDGLLVTCGDDKGVRELLKKYKGRRVTYGLSTKNDFIIKDIEFRNGKTEFVLENQNKNVGKFYLSVFGEQNVLDATAAILALLSLGLSRESIKKGLWDFQGTKRRSEYKGLLSSGAMLFDDYAHHPTEIENTLKAFKTNFPKKKIVCIFQPHTYSRTKSLFEQFSSSFKHADAVIVTEIYASRREKKDLTISARDLAAAIKKLHKEVIFLPKLIDVVEYVNKNQYKNDTVLITMGAGDVYKIAEKLKFQI